MRPSHAMGPAIPCSKKCDALSTSATGRRSRTWASRSTGTGATAWRGTAIKSPEGCPRRSWRRCPSARQGGFCFARTGAVALSAIRSAGGTSSSWAAPASVPTSTPFPSSPAPSRASPSCSDRHGRSDRSHARMAVLDWPAVADVRTPPLDMLRHQRFVTMSVVVVTVGIAALGRNQEARRAPLAAKRGGHLYQRMCAVCHGPTGTGYKADQAPAITHPDFLASAGDAFLRNAIQNGRMGTTMSAWSVERGSPLVASDIDAVIRFLRGWDRRPHPTLDEHPLTGDAAQGAEIYARECARCHGPRGTGGPYVNIGNPQLLSTATNGFLRQAIRNGRPGTAMAGFASTLGEGAIEDVIALLRNW